MTDAALIPTTKKPRVDTSADMSLDTGGKVSDQAATLQMFGPTQNAAGEKVPDVSEAATGTSQHESGEGEAASEFDLGVVGPSGGALARVQDEDAEYTAQRAAAKAKKDGDDDEAVIDALERAETAYEADHPAAEGAAARLNERLGSGADAGGSGSPGRHSSPARNQAHGKHAAPVDEATRAKVRSRLQASLRKNEGLKGSSDQEVAAAAERCEEACFSSSNSRTVYFSKASNASRLAPTVQDIAELPRIASGEAQQIAAGTVAASEPVQHSLTGFQEIAVKQFTS
ncbi:hypothetical protein WJX72_001691 [[Myrmecia] bisecta]|uniref:Uncharacterized protein n=1 Tax=[Myrmecia] bisecta TaxID=41462 RepID=A0AAW1PE70_9CHLO